MKTKVLLLLTAVCGVSITASAAEMLPSSAASNDCDIYTPEEKPSDYEAFKKAMEINDMKTWNKFLVDFPNSLFKNNAWERRHQLTKEIYDSEWHGDGKMFGFIGPVKTITQKMFYTDEMREFHFDENQRIVSGFLRDEDDRIMAFDPAVTALANKLSFTRDFEYGRIDTFTVKGTNKYSRMFYHGCGLLIKEVIYDKRDDSVIGRVEYVYTDYDEYGNWISRYKKVYRHGKMVDKGIEIRFISYWGEKPHPAHAEGSEYSVDIMKKRIRDLKASESHRNY